MSFLKFILKLYKGALNKWKSWGEKTWIVDEVMAFQPDTVEVEERRLPTMARWALYSILMLFFFAILWAWLAEVDRIVLTTGKLVETGQRIVIQPLQTSVMRSIDVKVGDLVKKGQVVAVLDPTFSQADVDQARSELQAVNYEIARLQSELNNEAWPARAGSGPNLAARKAAENATPQELAEREKEVRKGIEAMRNASGPNAGAVGRLAGLVQIAQMRKKLFESGFGSKLQYLEALDEVKRYKQDLSMRLLDAVRRRDRLEQDLAKAQRMDELGRLRAPEDGVVLEIVRKSAGSVVQAAEPVVTMVDSAAPLAAEVNIPARDIGWTKHGAGARVKLDAFPFQEHGTIEGRLAVITPDTFTIGPNGAPIEGEARHQAEASGGRTVYRARIELVKNNLRGIPPGFRMVPGMTVSAEIKVGKRSVISYFFDPIIKALDESIREPD